MERRKYLITDAFVLGAVSFPAGLIAYQPGAHDFGLVHKDSLIYREPHIGVTLDPSGGYPVISMPERYVRELGWISDEAMPKRDVAADWAKSCVVYTGRALFGEDLKPETADGGVVEGTNRTTGGTIGQP